MNSSHKNKNYIGLSTKEAETVTLRDSIKRLLEFYKINGKYAETHVINAWERLMGKTIASRTGKLYIKDGKLFVEILSAPLKQELLFQQEKIKQILNEEAGSEVVKEIVLL
jgi:predicted nucleic acid-binding Zn ribbon protein